MTRLHGRIVAMVSKHIRQRLDRALADTSRKQYFPRVGVIHLPTINSDHNPILLSSWQLATHRPNPFRFEQPWTGDCKCKHMICDAWSTLTRGSKEFKFNHKLKIPKRLLLNGIGPPL